jgi:hypothetical protein
MLEAMGKDKSEFTPADGPEIDTLFLIDRGRSTALFVKAHFHSREFSTDRRFSENIFVKIENFQLQKFFYDIKFVSANHILQIFLFAENFLYTIRTRSFGL